MSSVSNLSDLYIEELKDLWSANDQMVRALKKIATKATNPKLKQRLESSQKGIASHTDLLKALIANQDETVSKEHCKGMEGLVSEALKHTLEDGPDKGPVLGVCRALGRWRRFSRPSSSRTTTSNSGPP